MTLVTAALAVTSAAYQFLTNLHTVPITGRTQVVVLTNEEECVRALVGLLREMVLLVGDLITCGFYRPR